MELLILRIAKIVMMVTILTETAVQLNAKRNAVMEGSILVKIAITEPRIPMLQDHVAEQIACIHPVVMGLPTSENSVIMVSKINTVPTPAAQTARFQNVVMALLIISMVKFVILVPAIHGLRSMDALQHALLTCADNQSCLISPSIWLIFSQQHQGFTLTKVP